MSFRTEHEAFWAGEFGDAYIARNVGDQLLASNLALFSRALNQANGLASCIEFGANVGMNLRALKLLYPAQGQAAVEINASAVEVLRRTLAPASVFHASLLEYAPARQYELVLIKGVLIHIDPAHLTRVYDALYKTTGRYLLVCEYYNGFSFGRFVKSYPDLKGHVTDLLIGDLFEDKVDEVIGPMDSMKENGAYVYAKMPE